MVKTNEFKWFMTRMMTKKFLFSIQHGRSSTGEVHFMVGGMTFANEHGLHQILFIACIILEAA